MGTLDKLKFVANKPKKLPSRTKIINALDVQIESAKATIEGKPFVRTKKKWITNLEGSPQAIDQPLRRVNWFWSNGDVWYLCIRYGSQILPIKDGKPLIEVGAVDKLLPTLQMVREALVNGELDGAIKTLAEGKALSRRKSSNNSTKP